MHFAGGHLIRHFAKLGSTEYLFTECCLAECILLDVVLLSVVLAECHSA